MPVGAGMTGLHINKRPGYKVYYIQREIDSKKA